ncbi:MAG TPA: undecaprenyl-diphosphate phosphatase [Dissulfurispiraceae bacterium]|nr:undecaprenyl-diphosphate phosphatase [Dissulfurispiraceae bacterium]
MNIVQISILALIQGLAELLPVSSSAHVIVAEKLMGLDPTSPEMTLLLVMLHTGTMFSVIYYFWNSWKTSFFLSKTVFIHSMKVIGIATCLTAIVGLSLKYVIERAFLHDAGKQEIEHLFGNLLLIACSLAAVGILILFAGLVHRRRRDEMIDIRKACLIGIIQGFCLPFRGLSRSGATISTGLLLGVNRIKAEEFSFALAVVLTPPVIAREVMRLLQTRHVSLHGIGDLTSLFLPSLLGMALSFVAGLFALKWLSSWLEHNRWYWFGLYCICASLTVFGLHRIGL